MAEMMTGILPLLAGDIHLPQQTAPLRDLYCSAAPYPHLVLDGLFDQGLLREVIAEIPAAGEDKWVHERQRHLNKSNLRSAVDLGAAGNRLLSLLHSAKFLYLLSELTGIPALLPDPYLGGAGYHVMSEGGRFDVHADRNMDEITGLERRLAVLIYLNDAWRSEYGGALELWDRSGTRREKVVEPCFNRTMIMEVGDQNFHGVRPVTGRSRMSFAVYYHTVPNAQIKPHNTIYGPAVYRQKESLAHRVIRDLAPPLTVRVARRFWPNRAG